MGEVVVVSEGVRLRIERARTRQAEKVETREVFARRRKAGLPFRHAAKLRRTA